MAPVAAAVGILVGAVRRSVQGAVCWCVMTGVGSGGMTEAESGMMGAVYLRGRRMHGEMVRHACILVVMVEDAGSQCCLYWRMPQHARLASCACLPYSTTTVRSRAHPEPHPHLSPTRVSRAIISLPCIVTGHCDTGLPRPTSGAKMALTCKTRGCAVGVHLAGEVCRGNGSDKEGDARETRVTHGLEHGS